MNKNNRMKSVTIKLNDLINEIILTLGNSGLQTQKMNSESVSSQII